MSRTILVPFDGSEDSIEGLEYALDAYPRSDLTVFHVIELATVLPDDSTRGFDSWVQQVRNRREDAEELLETATTMAAGHGGTVSTATWIGSPAKSIVEYAETNGVDHVVIGSRGQTVESDRRLGSVAEAVLRRAPVLVTVIR